LGGLGGYGMMGSGGGSGGLKWQFRPLTGPSFTHSTLVPRQVPLQQGSPSSPQATQIFPRATHSRSERLQGVDRTQQACPLSPQLVQLPPTSSEPAGQKHPPPLQLVPPEQTVPHRPQLFWSFITSTH
jgi:hypothetical protein